MAEKLKPMRWRVVPERYHDESYYLRKAGVDLAVVAKAKAGGWYSYSLGLPVSWNTHATPCDLDEAKADAASRAALALSKKDETNG
jgi:hypothetical protein